MTVFDDLGVRSSFTYDWFVEQQNTIEYFKASVLLPEIRCMVSYCGEDWKELKLYKYKHPYHTGNFVKKCIPFPIVGKLCGYVEVVDWKEEEHSWQDWIGIAEDWLGINIEDYGVVPTETNVSECVESDCLNLY